MNIASSFLKFYRITHYEKSFNHIMYIWYIYFHIEIKITQIDNSETFLLP